MAEAVEREIKEIETLIPADKSLAYASLLALQRSSADNASSMEILSGRSPLLLPALLSDIYNPEEEIAAQALKCLGFMLYHQSLVSYTSEGDARSALGSLSRLIVTTKMKAICNLGVWCLSVQQLDTFTVECCFDAVLRAVVYAIDNPFGSLSTTFEAVQAVMKIATQLSKKMSETASIWLPPIYRRLISFDKKERDIAERCLMKTKSIICPLLTLSKAVAHDLQNILLTRIMDMQHNSHMKACIIQAWGWYMCLLGSSVLNDRILVNKMLKLPEQTFTDVEPQVQIASLVAWENLINAFLPSEMNAVQEEPIHEKISDCSRIPERVNYELSKDLLRRIKVLMVPLQGIISKSCHISVHMSCLSTWHYLLHKLDLLVNHPLVLQTTFRPFIEVVFSKKIDNENIFLWKPCLNLFDQYIFGMFKFKEIDFVPKACDCHLTNEKDSPSYYHSCRLQQMHYSIKWLPWMVGDLDFPLTIIKAIVSHNQMTPVEPEIRTFALSSAVRIFKSVILGVKAETNRPGVSFDLIQFCLTGILKFMKEFCEDIYSRKDRKYSHDLLWIAFQFSGVVREELGYSLKASPLYQVPLDLMYIKGEKSSKISCIPNVHAIAKDSMGYMDMVSPMIYTSFLLLDLLAQCIPHLSEINDIPLAIRHVKLLLFSVNPLANLKAALCFLYVHLSKPLDGKMSSLVLWRVIAKSLTEKIDVVLDMPVLEIEGADTTYSVLHWLLCYPFILFYTRSMDSDCSSLCLVPSQRDLLLKALIDVWNTSFDYLNYGTNACIRSSQNDFLNCLCKLLIKVLDENNTCRHKIIVHSTENSQNIDAFLLFSEMLICILVHALSDIEGLRVSLGGRDRHSSSIKKIFILFERFLGMSLMVLKTNQQSDLVIIDRIFDAMARLIGNLFLKQDALNLLEVISNPLVQFFLADSFSDNAWRGANQLYSLWASILGYLQRAHPPIDFDSNHLRAHSSLLRVALDHPYLPISNATIEFWKATYGKKKLFEFPDCLLPVLDKLSRSGAITIQRKNAVSLVLRTL